MSVFIGVSLVAREIERRSIYAILAKPLPRWEFIVGKYAGLVLTLVINVVAMTVVFYLVLAWLGWSSPENVRAAWTRPAVDARLLIAVAEILAELMLLTALALFFSTFSSSTLLSVALTLGLLVAGLFSGDLRNFGVLVEAPGALAGLVEAVGWVVPAFSAFDHKGAVVTGLPIESGRVWFNLLYAAAYTTAAVSAAVAVFSRREFT
jgi:ABC-type transport system involved in multi-copper enzyme maturation permease subunit